jgi:hypothetical protein
MTEFPGVALDKLQPKCANPSCENGLDLLGGGRFFRFQASDSANHHRVQHYWLCEHCAHLFTLVCNGHAEVVLKRRAKVSQD